MFLNATRRIHRKLQGHQWFGGCSGVDRGRSAAGPSAHITFGYQPKASGKDTGWPRGRCPDLKAADPAADPGKQCMYVCSYARARARACVRLCVRGCVCVCGFMLEGRVVSWDVVQISDTDPTHDRYMYIYIYYPHGSEGRKRIKSAPQKVLHVTSETHRK